MIILTIRTDKPDAEIGLYDDQLLRKYETWTAHRQLAETIHLKIQDLLQLQSIEWKDIGGIVCFQGPGSFTGLRIGLSVGNALAYGLHIPIIAASGGQWIVDGITRLLNRQTDIFVTPEYGSDVHITLPKR